MKKIITGILNKKLNAHSVKVIDDSPKHVGHSEAQKSGGGHYSVIVVSDEFMGKNLVERHRMVYAALAELKKEIHALAITAWTVKEFQQNSSR